MITQHNSAVWPVPYAYAQPALCLGVEKNVQRLRLQTFNQVMKKLLASGLYLRTAKSKFHDVCHISRRGFACEPDPK